VDVAYQSKEAWSIKALRNVAAMGPFSADRTIGEYADKIWKSKPLELAS
jgi:starch phosphorylase